ncbi:MAG: helix-turn-helix domain-containing protein [Cyanobacteria bacterium RI_101]|nr:helix-turn-helix domain-containing protein [Cyanobacteria bacterium RI_101]
MVLTLTPSELVFSPEDLENRRLHYYEKGETIPLSDKGGWQVYRGVVQVGQLLENGDEILLGWAQAPAFVGLDLTLLQLETYQAKALNAAYLRWYPREDLATASASVAQFVLLQTLKQLRQRETLLSIAGLKRVDERLQALLKLLAQEMGQPVAEGIRLSARLTHQMMANAIGTTRVTVTRLLGELQSQGKISFDGDRHLIIHPWGAAL